jgi:hypothetical protein
VFFTEALRDLGYAEGHNLILERRFLPPPSEQLTDVVADLVHVPVEVIVTVSTPASIAAAQATQSIPIVMVTGDPVRDGLAASYARPGGNVTGITLLNAALAAKTFLGRGSLECKQPREARGVSRDRRGRHHPGPGSGVARGTEPRGSGERLRRCST